MSTRFYWGRVVLMALLGIGIVLNPIYLYPDGAGHPKITYTVERVTDESTAQQALGQDQRILNCPVERPCALEERILEDGPIRYHGQIENSSPYPVIRSDEGVYLPRSELENGTTRLELEEVSPLEAVEHAAVPVEEFRPEVRTAVEAGSVTVYGERVEPFERGWIIEYDGNYYWNDGFRSTGTFWKNDAALPLLRGVLFALGVVILMYSGWTARTVADRAD